MTVLHSCRLATIPLASGESKQKGRTPATPWLRMLTQPAVWAIIINNFTFHYAFYVVMNWLPTYFDKVCMRHTMSNVSVFCHLLGLHAACFACKHVA
jgi:sugar phosphate permease